MSNLLRRQYDEMVSENARLTTALDAERARADAAVAALARLFVEAGEDEPLMQDIPPRTGYTFWFCGGSTRRGHADDCLWVAAVELHRAILAAQQGSEGQPAEGPHEFDGACRNVQHADTTCTCNHPVNGRRCGQSRYAPIHRDAAPTAAPGATEADG